MKRAREGYSALGSSVVAAIGGDDGAVIGDGFEVVLDLGAGGVEGEVAWADDGDVDWS